MSFKIYCYPQSYETLDAIYILYHTFWNFALWFSSEWPSLYFTIYYINSTAFSLWPLLFIFLHLSPSFALLSAQSAVSSCPLNKSCTTYFVLLSYTIWTENCNYTFKTFLIPPTSIFCLVEAKFWVTLIIRSFFQFYTQAPNKSYDSWFNYKYSSK